MTQTKNKWLIVEPMPSKRGGIAAVTLVNNSSIYVFGGEILSKTFNNNQKYDVKESKRMSELPMLTSRHGLGAVSYEDRIYVIGGGAQAGLSVTNVNDMFHTR